METKLCECGCGQPTLVAPRNWKSRGVAKGEQFRFIHGHNNANLKHGQARKTSVYRSYASARNRCNNPNSENWKHYGGRGINFLFESFAQFFAELGPRPKGTTLDRIDNDGHYAPGNVRWSTKSEQEHNKRRKQNVAVLQSAVAA